MMMVDMNVGKNSEFTGPPLAHSSPETPNYFGIQCRGMPVTGGEGGHSEIFFTHRRGDSKHRNNFPWWHIGHPEVEKATPGLLCKIIAPQNTSLGFYLEKREKKYGLSLEYIMGYILWDILWNKCKNIPMKP